MPWNCSTSIDLTASGFLSLVRAGIAEHEADALLSGSGFPGERTSRVGLFPSRELIILPSTKPVEIKDFCFSKGIPTIGWLSYELGMRLRGVQSRKQAPSIQGHLKQYGAMAEYDARTGACTLSAEDGRTLEALEALARTASPVASPVMPPPRIAAPSLTRKRYEEAVRRTLEYIRDGQAYQLNLSIEFTQAAPGLDPLALFLALLERHPAPFYAWYVSGDKRILSTSPERFLKVTGGQVLSRPIKGTRTVGTDEERARAELLDSEKECAELSMIVDLIRNDISHHCAYGSVAVANHRAVTRVDDLLQMHSDVTGTLKDGSTCLDLLLDALPGGSITGCPKKRAMELIEELEPHTRGVYCGSFVHIEDERNMDSSICIRTATHDTIRNVTIFHAGSGIVVDSDPASEYQETMAKVGKFLRPGVRL